MPTSTPSEDDIRRETAGAILARAQVLTVHRIPRVLSMAELYEICRNLDQEEPVPDTLPTPPLWSGDG